MELRTLVVFLDGSPVDQSVLRQAQALGSQASCLLLTEAVATHPWCDRRRSRELASQARQYLAQVASRLVFRGEVGIGVFYGDAAGAIAEQTCVRKADMVVMAHIELSGFVHGLSACVAQRVLDGSPVPVCFVRSTYAPSELRPVQLRPSVLVPLDGSTFAEAVLPDAARLANSLSAPLVLLQAIPLADSVLLPGSPAWDIPAVETLQADARAYLCDVAERLSSALDTPAPRILVRIGPPATAVIDVLRDGDFRLVVMATHAHARVRRLLLGSVTHEVLQHSPVPVVLMRPRALAVDWSQPIETGAPASGGWGHSHLPGPRRTQHV